MCFFHPLAVEDYQEAREFDGDSIAIKDGLERAQKLLKISRKRDYYKILGVSRCSVHLDPSPTALTGIVQLFNEASVPPFPQEC